MTDDEIKKSTVVHEKETLAGIAMLIIAAGATLIMACLQMETIDWERFLVGIVTILIGFLILFLRGYLKLNRWSHKTIIEDNTIMARLVKFLETKLGSK